MSRTKKIKTTVENATAPGEVLEPPGIYRMQRGQRDVRLERLPELETSLAE